MVHQQLLTPVVIYSTTRNISVNNNIQWLKSIAIYMRLYWVRNRVRQRHYLVYWARGKGNLANYLTKHHPTKHHHATRGTYIIPTADSSNHSCYQIPSNLWGCIKFPLPPPPGKHATDRQGILLLQMYRWQTDTERPNMQIV